MGDRTQKNAQSTEGNPQGLRPRFLRSFSDSRNPTIANRIHSAPATIHCDPLNFGTLRLYARSCARMATRHLGLSTDSHCGYQISVVTARARSRPDGGDSHTGAGKYVVDPHQRRQGRHELRPSHR
jgi:hypothetical protein